MGHAFFHVEVRGQFGGAGSLFPLSHGFQAPMANTFTLWGISPAPGILGVSFDFLCPTSCYLVPWCVYLKISQALPHLVQPLHQASLSVLLLAWSKEAKAYDTYEIPWL